MEDMRIYVADLAAYNNGILHGIWIDLPCDDIHEQVEKMLKHGEEWAIHDYELPFSISEWESFDLLNEIAELEEHELKCVSFLVDFQGYSLKNAMDSYDDVVIYSDMRLKDVAYDLVDQGCYGEIPETIKNYIDYDQIAYELDIEGYKEHDGDVFYCN